MGLLGLILMIGVASVSASAVYHSTFAFVTYDNGMNGLWASDHFQSQITIEELGDNMYRVSRVDGGWFETLGSASPGGDGSTFAAPGITGAISGGQVVIISSGTLIEPVPANPAAIDFRTLPSPRLYFSPYFGSYRIVEYESWGWEFETCDGRRWTDNDATESEYSAVGPNDAMGDIAGEPAVCESEPAANIWVPGVTDLFHYRFTNSEFFGAPLEIFWVDPLGNRFQVSGANTFVSEYGDVSLNIPPQAFPANPGYGTYNTSNPAQSEIAVWGRFIAVVYGVTVQDVVVAANDSFGQAVSYTIGVDDTNQDPRPSDDGYWAWPE